MDTNSEEQLYERLARAEIKVVESGKKNHLAFNNSKDEVVVFN